MEYYVVFLAIVGYLVLNLILSFVVGSLARRKGRSYAALFWISFFFGFITGLIVLALLTPSEGVRMSVSSAGVQAGPVHCPHCKELIRPDAVVCKHCGKDVDPVLPELIRQAQARREAEFTRHEAIRKARAEKLRAFWSRKSNRAWVISVASALVAVIIAVPTAFIISSQISNQQTLSRIAEEIPASDWSKAGADCEPSSSVKLISQSKDSIELEVRFTQVGDDFDLSDKGLEFMACLGRELGLNTIIDANSPRGIIVNENSVFDFASVIVSSISHHQYERNDDYSTCGAIDFNVNGPVVDPGWVQEAGPWEIRVSQTENFGREFVDPYCAMAA